MDPCQKGICQTWNIALYKIIPIFKSYLTTYHVSGDAELRLGGNYQRQAEAAAAARWSIKLHRLAARLLHVVLLRAYVTEEQGTEHRSSDHEHHVHHRVAGEPGVGHQDGNQGSQRDNRIQTDHYNRGPQERGVQVTPQPWDRRGEDADVQDGQQTGYEDGEAEKGSHVCKWVGKNPISREQRMGS